MQKDSYDRVDKKAKVAEVRLTAYRKLLEERLAWMRMLTALNKAVPEGLWITSLTARKQGDVIQGLDLSISSWRDLESVRSQAGKTIDETVATRLAEQSVFSNASGAIRISKKDMSVPWMTSFNISADLRSAQSAQGATTTRSGRRAR